MRLRITVGAATLSNTTASLKGVGATFQSPLRSKWFCAYEKSTGVCINYQPIGSSAGTRQLKAGTVDFGESDVLLHADVVSINNVAIMKHSTTRWQSL